MRRDMLEQRQVIMGRSKIFLWCEKDFRFLTTSSHKGWDGKQETEIKSKERKNFKRSGDIQSVL